MVAPDRITALARLRPAPRLRALSALLTAPEVEVHEPAALMLLDLCATLCARAAPPSHRWTALLSRGRADLRDRALAVVATRLTAFPPEVRDLALTLDVPAWTPVLRRGCAPVDSLGVRSLAQLAAHRGEFALVDHLVAGLADADPGAAQAAEAAIELLALAADPGIEPDLDSALEHLESARRLWGVLPVRWAPPQTPEERTAFHAAIADAAKDFERHRRRGVVLAAALLLDRATARSGPLSAWLAQHASDSQSALRGVLRWSRLATVHLRAWEWLWREDLANSAADRISHARSVEEHEVVLSRSALALRPARAKRLTLVLAPARTAATPGQVPVAHESPLPDALQVRSLSRLARVGLALLGASVRGDARQRHLAVEPLLLDEDPLVRHALVRRGPRRMLEDLCFDADARVARSAFLRRTHAGALSHPSPGDTKGPQRAARFLSRSPHPELRAWAGQEQEELSPLGVRERLAERRRLARDRAALVDDARRRLASGDAGQRLSGALTIRRLGLATDAHRELAAVVRAAIAPGQHSPEDARAAATAVAALGGVPDPEARDVVVESLAAHDPRIRANAVEAISLARPRGVAPVLVELKDDPEHRVRANALRAIIMAAPPLAEPKSPPGAGAGAVESLFAMLTDGREMHRLAAVWAAGRLAGPRGRAGLSTRWPELLARVIETARFDDSPAVRRRAVLAAVVAQSDARVQCAPDGVLTIVAGSSDDLAAAEAPT